MPSLDSIGAISQSAGLSFLSATIEANRSCALVALYSHVVRSRIPSFPNRTKGLTTDDPREKLTVGNQAGACLGARGISISGKERLLVRLH